MESDLDQKSGSDFNLKQIFVVKTTILLSKFALFNPVEELEIRVI